VFLMAKYEQIKDKQAKKSDNKGDEEYYEINF
jgi:hypothetical protein